LILIILGKEVRVMAVRVLIKRRVPPDKAGELYGLITELRSMASRQPGYVSGETLRNIKDANEYLVISTWETLEDWNNWIATKKRQELQGMIDALLGQETVYDIYDYPDKRLFKALPEDYLQRAT